MKLRRTYFAAALLAATALTPAFAQQPNGNPVGPAYNYGIVGSLPGQTLPFVTSTGGTKSRAVSDKLGDALSLLDFGAMCDSSSANVGDGTDDTAAVLAAEASGRPIRIPGPSSVCRTSINNGSFNGVFLGPGRLKDNINHMRGPVLHHALTPPTAFGSSTNVVQAFDGDLSQVPWAQEQRVLGNSLQLGGPTGTAGYWEPPELAGEYLFTYLASGGSDATRRTGLAGHEWVGYHAGDGDLVGWGAACTVQGGPASAGHIPSCSLLSGTITAAGQDVGLQGVGDIDFVDNGNRAFVTGLNFNLQRTVTNAGGGLDIGWMAYRAQSTGSVPVDAAFSTTGSFKMVLDAVDATTTAAAVLGAGQRIYGNGTNSTASKYPWDVALGTEWEAYDGPSGCWQRVIGSIVIDQACAGAHVAPVETTGRTVGHQSSHGVVWAPTSVDTGYHALFQDGATIGIITMTANAAYTVRARVSCSAHTTGDVAVTDLAGAYWSGATAANARLNSGAGTTTIIPATGALAGLGVGLNIDTTNWRPFIAVNGVAGASCTADFDVTQS